MTPVPEPLARYVFADKASLLFDGQGRPELTHDERKQAAAICNAYRAGKLKPVDQWEAETKKLRDELEDLKMSDGLEVMCERSRFVRETAARILAAACGHGDSTMTAAGRRAWALDEAESLAAAVFGAAS